MLLLFGSAACSIKFTVLAFDRLCKLRRCRGARKLIWPSRYVITVDLGSLVAECRVGDIAGVFGPATATLSACAGTGANTKSLVCIASSQHRSQAAALAHAALDAQHGLALRGDVTLADMHSLDTAPETLTIDLREHGGQYRGAARSARRMSGLIRTR